VYRALALALVALPVLPAAGGAQQQQQASRPAVLAGAVRDPAGAPIPGAGVQLDGSGQWVGVDERGQFRIAGLAAGRHVLRVRALGFAAIEGTLDLVADSTIEVDVTLERVTALDTVRTLAATVSLYGPPDFRERRARGGGFYLTRDEFERNAPSRLSDILARVPGVRRHARLDAAGVTAYVYTMRGVSTLRGEVCPINVYLDGRNLDLGQEDLDRLVRPSDIEAIEVYTGSAQIPPRFNGPTARCGVLVLWTRASAR